MFRNRLRAGAGWSVFLDSGVSTTSKTTAHLKIDLDGYTDTMEILNAIATTLDRHFSTHVPWAVPVEKKPEKG